MEATPARTYDEVAATKTMIVRTEETLGLKPDRLVADTAYGTGKFLGWLVGTGITPHIPVWDKSDREDGTFSRSDFTFNRERNVYVCPADKLLKTTGNVGRDHKLRYFALKRDCGGCLARIASLASKPAGADDTDKVIIAIAPDHIWIYDGNHRIAAAIVRGDIAMKVWIASYEELAVRAHLPSAKPL